MISRRLSAGGTAADNVRAAIEQAQKNLAEKAAVQDE
jgi:hypothetical protein